MDESNKNKFLVENYSESAELLIAAFEKHVKRNFSEFRFNILKRFVKWSRIACLLKKSLMRWRKNLENCQNATKPRSPGSIPKYHV